MQFGLIIVLALAALFVGLLLLFGWIVVQTVIGAPGC